MFHDIVNNNNIVPCEGGTPNCADGEFGYNAGIGYDLTTGLGSVGRVQPGDRLERRDGQRRGAR